MSVFTDANTTGRNQASDSGYSLQLKMQREMQEKDVGTDE